MFIMKHVLKTDVLLAVLLAIIFALIFFAFLAFICCMFFYVPKVAARVIG